MHAAEFRSTWSWFTGTPGDDVARHLAAELDNASREVCFSRRDAILGQVLVFKPISRRSSTCLWWRSSRRRSAEV